MKLIKAFLRLIRWPNLLFIVLTQVLFYYCIHLPVFDKEINTSIAYKLSPPLFWCLVASSVLIAAAGYIINDYFDFYIDQVNKPQHTIIQKLIRRRSAIIWHILLSLTGVALAFYVAYKIGNPLLGFINLLCVLLLWVYSTTFKKKLIIGNVIISLLTAWVVFVLYFSELRIMFWRWEPAFKNNYQQLIAVLFKYAIVYTGFAFIISLIREVVKDLEDMEGDRKYECRTMPIVWGIPATKVFAGVWLVVLIVTLLIIQVYGFLKGWWLGSLYTLLLVIIPLIYITAKLYKAVTVNEYHQLSVAIKLVMLTGILSILFFKLYM